MTANALQAGSEGTPDDPDRRPDIRAFGRTLRPGLDDDGAAPPPMEPREALFRAPEVKRR